MRLETASRHEPLWVPIVAPAIWSLHFMVCYTAAALWCGRFAGTHTIDLRTLTAIVTVVALIAIAFFFHHGLRRRRYQLPTHPHDEDTPEDRDQFVAFTTLLLAGMSFVAVAFEALAIVVVNRCGA
jgi:hypothetical protein